MSRPHTRATNQSLFECDAELERTIRRSIRRSIVDTIVDNIPDEEIPINIPEEEEIPEGRMAARTMKEELEPDLMAMPLAVRIP